MDHDHGTPRAGAATVDEDLVDFLERHETGPCPDCDDARLDRLEARLQRLAGLVATMARLVNQPATRPEQAK